MNLLIVAAWYATMDGKALRERRHTLRRQAHLLWRGLLASPTYSLDDIDQADAAIENEMQYRLTLPSYMRH
jgi:hypothetical protein